MKKKLALDTRYGNESYTAIVKVIQLRKSMRDYVLAAMKNAADSGMPVNRPLWWDFPADKETWGIMQAYMFGPDYLVSPVTEMGARSWSVYLPAGVSWAYHFNGTVYVGGQTISVSTPLDEFPLFKRQ